MTERGGAIIYCRILVPLNAPFTRRHNNYNYLNNKEGAPLSFWDFGALQCPPPYPDATILNDLNDRERGRHYSMRV